MTDFSESSLSIARQHCFETARRYDHDRWLCSLFAPQMARNSLFALLSLNAELARIRESVKESMLGEIRLQWWRDAVENLFQGRAGDQPIIQALHGAVEEGRLDRANIDRLIDARERDLGDDLLPDLAALEKYAEGTSASLNLAMLEILEIDSAAARSAARHVGIGWGLIGILRAVPFHAAHGLVLLPADLLEGRGLDRASVVSGRQVDALAPVMAEVAGLAREHLEQARALRKSVPKEALPALLPAALADLYLNRLERAGFDPTHESLSISGPRKQVRLLGRSLLRRY